MLVESIASVEASAKPKHFDPRLRLLLVLLSACLVTVLAQIKILMLVNLIAFAGCLLSTLTLKALIKRLFIMDGFLLVVFVTLPFSVNPVSIEDQWFALNVAGFNLIASESGLHLALLIILKANATLLFLQAFAGGMTITEICHSAKAFKLPSKLVFLMAFTLRYLDVIHQQYVSMRKAMKLRGFAVGFNRHSFKTLGYLVGMLLIRSLLRSERIHQAMRCRGFVDKLYLLDALKWQSRDTLMLLLSVLLMAGFLWVDQAGLIA